MCIYGVTRIGAGSEGWAGCLPGLVRTLQILKPLLVFATGAWFLLYLINRRTRTAAFRRRVLLMALAVGAAAVTDAAAEESYLVIPKKEYFLASGCCSAAALEVSDSARFLPQALIGDRYRPWLFGAFYGLNGGLALALSGLVGGVRWTGKHLVPVLGGAMAALGVSGIFLTEIAAPRLLHMPEHHCAYDLIPGYPAALSAVGLFFLGAFAVGWSCWTDWFGGSQETRPFQDRLVRRLLRLGAWSYLLAVVILTVELWRA
jgi:hypothetical protein